MEPIVSKTPGAETAQRIDPNNASIDSQPNHDDPFRLNTAYLTHLASLPPMPKKIHVFFPDKHYHQTHADLPFVQHSILALTTLNPDWTVTVYDDADINEIIRRGVQHHDGLITQEECDILLGEESSSSFPAHIVERSDLARILLLYLEGGVYVDADRLVSLPMSRILTETTKLCLPTFNDVNFCQDLQCTSPGNELYLSIVRAMSQRRMMGGENGKPLERRRGWVRGGELFEMGPVVYNERVMQVVFAGLSTKDMGMVENSYAKAREALEKYGRGLILTKKDKDCMDGLLVDSSIGQCFGREELYDAYGLKPWAEAVDAVWEGKEEVNNEDGEGQGQKKDGSGDKNKPDSGSGNETPETDLFKLNTQYLDHLRSLGSLPKKVHILFPDKLYYENQKDLPFVQHSIISLIKLNPDWNVTVYDNDDVDNVIRGAGLSGLISKEEADILVGTKDENGNILTEAAHIVERSDIARLILMYTQGGFYLDADRLVSIPMSKIVQPSTRLCLPTFNDVNFCQDLQCTSPENELFLSMIRECSEIRMKKGPGGGPLERRKGWSKGGALFDMGPVVYNKNILNIVFEGVSYNNIEELGGYTKARESLVNSDGLILTKRDKNCNDGLLVDKSIECYDRHELYDKYGMKRWAVAVDALWAEKV
ncbi:hypothetical protein HJC23_013206 [Cyclotella cryptica]|uniref:Glycosyltransferase family 32 protein n=1 Tax=Cyclotella cryptica TaxID=29204 RepID=A0ABD3QDG4_9STRA